MTWIVGHVAAYRGEVLAALGGASERATRLKTLFGKDVTSGPAEWPPVAELANDLRELHEAIVARLRALGDAAFDRTIQAPGGATLPAMLFLHFHESYHVGQLGYLRTWLGKAPLVAPGPVPG
jgi:hypothetical protein